MALLQDAHAELATYALVVAPPRFLTSGSLAITFFSSVAADSPIPLWVYSNAKATGVEIDPDAYWHISRIPQVHGIKLGLHGTSEQTLTRAAMIASGISGGVRLAIGDGVPLCNAIESGVSAWHSTIAGVIPASASKLVTALQRGSEDVALSLSSKMATLANLIRTEGGAQNVLGGILEAKGLVDTPLFPSSTSRLTTKKREDLFGILRAMELSS